MEHNGEVYPGLLATGIAVATLHGLPRMDPTFLWHAHISKAGS